MLLRVRAIESWRDRDIFIAIFVNRFHSFRIGNYISISPFPADDLKGLGFKPDIRLYQDPKEFLYVLQNTFQDYPCPLPRSYHGFQRQKLVRS